MSPSTMQEIADHVSRCCIAAQALIFGEISKRGTNNSDRPYDLSFHDGEWWVYVDVDMPAGTFDVETHSVNQYDAIASALSRVRRSFTSAAAA